MTTRHGSWPAPYEPDLADYFEGLTTRVAAAFAESEMASEEDAEYAVSSLRNRATTAVLFPGHSDVFPWSPDNIARDKRLLKHLKKFLDKVQCIDFWEGPEEICLRPPGASRQHGKVSIHLTRNIEAEIESLDLELKSNASLGKKRRWKNAIYNHAGVKTTEVLRDMGVHYAAAEAAVLLWHCGAQKLDAEGWIEVIDPGDRREVGRDLRVALDAVARKRFKAHHPDE